MLMFPIQDNPTARGETDVFIIDVETGAVSQRIELCDVIGERNKEKSKCRFLTHR